MSPMTVSDFSRHPRPAASRMASGPDQATSPRLRLGQNSGEWITMVRSNSASEECTAWPLLSQGQAPDLGGQMPPVRGYEKTVCSGWLVACGAPADDNAVSAFRTEWTPCFDCYVAQSPGGTSTELEKERPFVSLAKRIVLARASRGRCRAVTPRLVGLKTLEKL